MLQIAFDVGKPEDLSDWTITIFTGSVCTHCELVFSNGQSFSSSPKDKGTRFTEIDYPSNPLKWDLYDIFWITPEQEKEIYRFCHSQLNKGYDWRAIFLGWAFVPAEAVDKWFCTEVLRVATRQYMPHVSDRWYSPNSYRNAIKMERDYYLAEPYIQKN